MNKKTIELLKDVNYFEAHAARNIRPFPPSQITGQPPAEMTMLDNSVQHPEGARLDVELDAEWQELEPVEGKTWFRNASHPGGFQVPNSDFRYVDPPAE